MLERWLRELASELNVEQDIDETSVLKAARVVAHTVERKAAPLSTFMIGLAAGRTGAPVDQLSEKTIELARGFPLAEE